MLAPKANLLLVDDDPALRVSLSMVLASVGYRVRLAGDGFAALAEIRNELPDVILSDMNMPEMSGFELLSVIRRRFPSIRVIAMSGGFADSDEHDGVAADAYHRKGGNLSSLLATLESMTGPDRLPLTRTGEVSPIWIPRIVRDSTGMGSIVLTCPDCLREFSHVLEGSSTPVRETDCIHCATVIPYALVQQSETLAEGLSMEAATLQT
jgi:CheY-like chemotaxis protein